VFDAILLRRPTRLILQLVLLLTAAAVVAHGLFGPQIAPRNLATVVTWVHYRGLLVVALLALGNVFCTACPMVLVRDTGRRLFHPAIRWPRRLRGKWLGLALLVAVLFVYELFDLWALPRATAWLVIGYFVAALVVDTTFAGAAFCKHLCPIGQFNFVASTMSPTELRVRERATCVTCRTSDCIRGRRNQEDPRRVERRGCELALFMPAKIGNLDCTLCLDCVRACPHDNISLTRRLPGVELLDLRRRSGVGRLMRRPDLAALALVFTFGGLLNAFAMTAPAAAAERWLATAGIDSEAAVLAILFAGGLIGLPLVLVGGAAIATRALAGHAAGSNRALVVRYSYALLPLGFAVWLAHYGFHLLTGVFTVVPVTQSAAIDLFGWPVLGEPFWRWTGMSSGAVYPIQLGLILLGAAGATGLVRAIAVHERAVAPRAESAVWTSIVAVLTLAAIWILSQPMEMRGMTLG
jgi:polyferredoxin